jgi:two-component system phosphate regulon sensor histidine kinase PhoR
LTFNGATKIRTTTDHFWRELKLIDGPARWFYWAAGLLSVWIYQHGDLNTGAVLWLSLYLGLNVALIPMLPRANLGLRRYLAVGLYVTDLLFASLLIYHTGGYFSQLFLLYCLLPFKAAIYYPYVHRIVFVSFLIFPLYIATLYLSTGTLVFLPENLFLSRYVLLLLVVFAGMYTAWHLDNRQRQTRALLDQLEIEHRLVDERRRELHAVLDSIVDGVVVVDPELRLLMINPVAADAFNIPYPQPSGTPLSDLINHPTLLTLLRKTLNVAEHEDALLASPQRNGAGLITDEIRAHPIRSGKPIICQALATALVSEQDALHGAVVVLRDMTRQKELDEAKSNFISVLSHELRTPLTTIRGFVELILTGNTGDITRDQRECLNTVFAQTGHLQSLINALLEFAELEAAEIHLQLSPVSLEKLVYKMLGRIEPLAEHYAIGLQAQIAPDLAPIHADGPRLERVLFNLLDNAVKFTPEHGQVTVTVSDQDSQVLVCVTDTGPGIPPTERERIFERFYQIDDSSTRMHGGTGLGLAICKHIVELHQGRIWVEEPDERTTDKGGPGSRFCFTIPRDLAQQTDSELGTVSRSVPQPG